MPSETHNYFSFISDNGIALSNINPGSDVISIKNRRRLNRYRFVKA